jgi:hypothetical protein
MSGALSATADSAQDYGAVRKPAWALRLEGNANDITKVRIILQLTDACDHKVALGNDIIGHFVIGTPALSAQVFQTTFQGLNCQGSRPLQQPGNFRPTVLAIIWMKYDLVIPADHSDSSFPGRSECTGLYTIVILNLPRSLVRCRLSWVLNFQKDVLPNTHLCSCAILIQDTWSCWSMPVRVRSCRTHCPLHCALQIECVVFGL